MDEDIWKVVSYIRREQAKSAGISLDIFIASSKEKSAPYMGGNPQVGEKLFFSEEIVCGKCHTLGGKGGGGRADFAQAGGTEINKIEEAFEKIKSLI